MLEGEEERAWEFTDFQTFLEAEGLFGRETPEGDDPVGFPIRVLGELQHDIAMRAYWHRHNQTLSDRLTAWDNSLEKLTLAYEIIAYPHFDDAKPYKAGMGGIVRDAIEHANKDVENHPHRAPIELNDEELNILGKLTQARGLPFNPEKRVYRFAELSALLEAEHVVFELEWQARRQQASEPDVFRSRQEIEERWRKREEKRRGEGSDEPPTPPELQP